MAWEHCQIAPSPQGRSAGLHQGEHALTNVFDLFLSVATTLHICASVQRWLPSIFA